MHKQYFKEYSPSLGRDMEGMVYGHAGRPMLFIPCQDGHHPDFEGFTLSGKGEVKVVGEGITEWRDDENGRYQILVPNEAQRQQILDYFVEILKTKPKYMQ